MFFFSSRRRHTRYWRDWSSDVCSSDLDPFGFQSPGGLHHPVPGVRWRAYPCLPEHLLVVEEILGVQYPRHTVVTALVLSGFQCAGKDLTPLALREAVGNVHYHLLAGEFGRPDHIH